MSRQPEKSTRFHPIAGETPGDVVRALKEQIARLQRARLPCDQTPVSSGCQALDQVLPDRGFRWGTLVEWLAAEPGCGAETLALATARAACQVGGVLVVLDAVREFYPPAAARMGVALEKLIVVQPQNQADTLWALDQSLRSLAVAAVLAWPARLDGHTFRRLQLAAEEGGGVGLLVRPPTAQREPSWADVRLLVEPVPVEGVGTCGRSGGREGDSPIFVERKLGQSSTRVRIQLLRSRGGADGRNLEVEIDNETHTMHLASELAHPTTRRRAAGA